MTASTDVMYRLLVQGVTDYAIFMLDPDGIVVNWNTGAERAKQFTGDEMIGRHFACLYRPEDRAAGLPEAGLRQARETGRFEVEGWRIRRDGTWFWAEIVIDAIRDEDGGLIGFAKITRDRSDRRTQELQLVEAKEIAERHRDGLAATTSFLDSVIATMPSSVVVQDAATGLIRLANRHAELLLCGCTGQLVGRPAELVLPTAVAALLKTALAAAGQPAATAGQPAATAGQPAAAEAGEPAAITQELPVPTAWGLRTLRMRALAIGGHGEQPLHGLLIAEDVSEERAASMRIHHLAHYDGLTGLPNRELFRQRLGEALAAAASGSGTAGTAVLCIDLDDFKRINDTLGHPVGDQMLRALVRRLREVLRPGDCLARLNGDKFAVVAPLLATQAEEEAEALAERLIAAAREPIEVEGQRIETGLSVGIALAPADADSGEGLLRCGDLALYEAKRRGRGRFLRYHDAFATAARYRRLIEADLRGAIARRELRLHYQPIVRAQDGETIGYEALLRWQHPVRGPISPLDFIPIAEETGLIHEIGAFVLHEACREASRWASGRSVAVNLSPAQFRSPALAAQVASALAASGLQAGRLELEITESVLLDASANNLALLEQMKQLGARIALDDFGTGYSSLSYLCAFRFDKIKIDRSFVREICDSREALAVVRAITGLSRSLRIATTAEGVETPEQAACLRREGCTQLQGYLYGKPMPPAALPEVRGGKTAREETVREETGREAVHCRS
ncbi:PAS domain S-box-containing protein/diguanylate cyclase (GGDEF) domain-containing protein [Methylobacterium sp. 174MFSha1.1]|uniref:sensor domain-containing protein n=1 Tax=Methylobacterium sp. 174MFSha1.1 TaxID=1502749 RepID=UPI0008F456AA|nr:EAL domain-containing protein [Methylobacterium sp. 174MFSha1.1]SFU90385.1 PAS domain S-box-containing protein/diguanylate cyclase (GGDEF) domain-containing protein [Methylobacterium sp. 174MFSha1.1]